MCPIPLFAVDAAQRIDAIKAAHGFPDSYDLLERLLTVWHEVRDWSEDDEEAPSAKQKRAFAKKVATHAAAILKEMHDAHVDEIAHMFIHATAEPIDPELKLALPTCIDAPSEVVLAPEIELARASRRLVQLNEDLKWLAENATKANKRKAREGRPPNILKDRLLHSLLQLYVDQFGDVAIRPTKSEGIYSGPLIQFVDSMFPLFGENRLLNSWLGDRLTRMIKGADPTQGKVKLEN